jgi:hypothetical protein
VQSLLPSDNKKVPTSKGRLKKSRDKLPIRSSMVQPIEVLEEPPMGQTRTKHMTKVRMGNALLAVNSGLVTSIREKLRGSENQRATERPWQFENTSMVTTGISPENMMPERGKMMHEPKLARCQTEVPNIDDPPAGQDLSPRLQG